MKEEEKVLIKRKQHLTRSVTLKQPSILESRDLNPVALTKKYLFIYLWK